MTARADSRGVGLGADTRSSTQTNITEDLSLNLRWDVNERLGLNFDIQKIDSTVVNFDNSSNNKTAADLYLDITRRQAEVRVPQPDGLRLHGRWLRRSAELVPRMGDGARRRQLRAKSSPAPRRGHRARATAGLDSLRVGVRRAEREQNVNWSTYNWGSVQPLWGVQADVPLFLNQGHWQDTLQRRSTWVRTSWAAVCSAAARSCIRASTSSSNYQATHRRCTATAAATPGSRWASAPRCPVDPSTERPVLPGRTAATSPKTRDAAYVMFKFGGDDTKIGNVSVKGNIGVRCVKTDVVATGGVAVPACTTRRMPPTPASVDPPRLRHACGRHRVHERGSSPQVGRRRARRTGCRA